MLHFLREEMIHVNSLNLEKEMLKKDNDLKEK